MYISGLPLLSESVADQAPSNLVNEAGSNGGQREATIRPGFLFRPNLGHRLALLDDGNPSLPDLIQRAVAFEILAVEEFPLVFGLACRFHLPGGELSKFRTTLVVWHQDQGHFSQLSVTEPHLMPESAMLLEVVAVDMAGMPLARRQASLSNILAARLNARIGRVRASNYHGVIPSWHSRIIERLGEADIENFIPTAKRAGDYCLAPLV